MNDPQITTDELYRLNDAITAWAADCGLRARRADDTDDQYDDDLNEAVHAAAAAMSGERDEAPSILFTVGVKAPNMGDGGDGEQVVLDASRASVDSDGVTRIPVVSHHCPDDGGELRWDDGYQIDGGMAGVTCAKGCGYTFCTETRER